MSFVIDDFLTVAHEMRQLICYTFDLRFIAIVLRFLILDMEMVYYAFGITFIGNGAINI